MSEPKKAIYRFNKGDTTKVTIIEYDGKGRAWVKWADGFINMVDAHRLEVIDERETSKCKATIT